MSTLKELREMAGNLSHKLFEQLPNYHVSKLIAEDLDCDIQDVLVVINNLVPNVDLCFIYNDKYYRVYKYNAINHNYKAEVLRPREVKDSTEVEWRKYDETIDSWILNQNIEVISAESYNEKRALVTN